METLQRTANRGSLATGYDIDHSCKFEDMNDEYLYRTNVSGTNTKTWTVSWWFKTTELGSIRGSYLEHWQGGVYGEATRAGIDQYDRLWVDVGGGDGNAGTLFRSLSTQLIRDVSAWYHICIACDSTQSTEADRLKVWLNGVEVTTWDQHQIPTLNFASAIAGFGGIQMKWGSYDSTYHGYSGYLAECHYLDGVTAQNSDFGEFDEDTGIWKPKAYEGTITSPSQFLEFKDGSDLGTATSGLDADYLENISAADQATDTPTNNFATMNVLWGTNRMPLMSEGATEFGNNVNDYRYAPATMGVANGKWYWEIKPTVNGNTLVSGAGIASNQETLFFYQTTGNFVYHYDGDRYVNGGASSFGAAWATNDIIGFAYDADNWTLTCYVNNSSQGNLLASQTDISSELFIPYVYSFGTHTYQTNFGGYTTMSNTHTNTDGNGYGSFVYTPPSGYYALCTKNLAEYG